MREYPKKICLFFLFVLFSYCVLLFGNGPLGKCNNFEQYYDINIYHVIGREWLQKGVIPFVSLSDIKGPCHFLCYGIVSFLSPESLTGVRVFTSFIVGIGLFYAYITARLFLTPALSLALVSFYVLYTIDFAGNPSEMVWMFHHVILYVMLSYLCSQKKRGVRYSWLFFMGVAIVFTIFSKYNMAVALVPIAAYMMFIDKPGRTKIVFMRVASLALGGGMVAALVLVYFISAGALDDLFKEYFWVTLLYGKTPLLESALVERHLWIFSEMVPKLPQTWPRFGVCNILIGGLLSLSWVLLYRRTINKDIGFVYAYLCYFFLDIAANLVGRFAFSQYFVTLYPHVWLSLVCFGIASQKILRDKGVRMLWGLWAIPYALVFIIIYEEFRESEESCRSVHNQSIMDMISSTDEKILCIHTDATVFYRTCNQTPLVKYFVPQMIPGGYEKYRSDLVSCISSQRPGYLLGSIRSLQVNEEMIKSSGGVYQLVFPNNVEVLRKQYPKGNLVCLWKRVEQVGEAR